MGVDAPPGTATTRVGVAVRLGNITTSQEYLLIKLGVLILLLDFERSIGANDERLKIVCRQS